MRRSNDCVVWQHAKLLQFYTYTRYSTSCTIGTPDFVRFSQPLVSWLRLLIHVLRHIKNFLLYSWCLLFALLQNKRTLYTLFYIHLIHVSSSSCFSCLARCGFRFLPSFRWDALWGIYNPTLPFPPRQSTNDFTAAGIMHLSPQTGAHRVLTLIARTTSLVLRLCHLPAESFSFFLFFLWAEQASIHTSWMKTTFFINPACRSWTLWLPANLFPSVSVWSSFSRCSTRAIARANYKPLTVTLPLTNRAAKRTVGKAQRVGSSYHSQTRKGQNKIPIENFKFWLVWAVVECLLLILSLTPFLACCQITSRSVSSITLKSHHGLYQASHSDNITVCIKHHTQIIG